MPVTIKDLKDQLGRLTKAARQLGAAADDAGDVPADALAEAHVKARKLADQAEDLAAKVKKAIDEDEGPGLFDGQE